MIRYIKMFCVPCAAQITVNYKRTPVCPLCGRTNGRK